MTVEIPYAPVDTVIREAAPSLRVSSGATEELAARIQEKGASLAVSAAENASKDGRKTIMLKDLTFDPPEVGKEDLTLPVAPIDRIARLRIDDYRVSKDARIALAAYLETWSVEAAESAALLADHAGRRTIQHDDVEVYFQISD